MEGRARRATKGVMLLVISREGNKNLYAREERQSMQRTGKLLLNVALVFGMALAVGEGYAGEDEQAAEDLSEAEGFAE